MGISILFVGGGILWMGRFDGRGSGPSTNLVSNSGESTVRLDGSEAEVGIEYEREDAQEALDRASAEASDTAPNLVGGADKKELAARASADDIAIQWTYGTSRGGRSFNIRQCQSMTVDWSMGDGWMKHSLYEFESEDAYRSCDFGGASRIVGPKFRARAVIGGEDTISVTKRWFGSREDNAIIFSRPNDAGEWSDCGAGGMRFVLKTRPKLQHQFAGYECVGTPSQVKTHDSLSECRRMCRSRTGCFALQFRSDLRSCELYSREGLSGLSSPSRQDVQEAAVCELAVVDCAGGDNFGFEVPGSPQRPPIIANPRPSRSPTRRPPTRSPTRRPGFFLPESPQPRPTRSPTRRPPTRSPTRRPPTRSPTRRPPTRVPSNDEVVDVAIVGGGVAGLSAARSLALGGLDNWVVLEGSERLGGRARSKRWSGSTINTGAYYVSGKRNGNPFYEAIKRYGLRTRDIDYNSWTTYGEGEERWEDMEKGSDCLDETAHRMWEEFDATGRYQETPAREVLEQCGWRIRSAMDRAIEWNYYDWEYGRTPDDLSVYASPAYSYHDFGSVQPLISDEGGIAKFLIGLLNDFVPPPHSADTRFRLNSPVNTILTHSTRCPTEAGPNCVELRLNGGKTIFAKHAILTASFGVLQRTHQTLLPQGFPGRDVLHKFTMGYFEKVYFRFRQRFWDDTDFILDSKHGHPVLMWHPNPHQQQSQRKVLQVTITGNDALNLIKTSNAQIEAYLMGRLTELYPDKFTLDDVVDTYFTNWAESSVSYGAWFEFSIGSTPADYLRLIQPVGNLIIGGEMTCKRYYGYVHGAMVSGERDANRILAKLGRPAYDDRRCDS